jgi:thiamine biosynthesis lipoprotein
MTLSRRRFLTISAAFAAVPASAHAHSWQGYAFGAEISLTIRGPREQANAALSEARALIADIESLFSLHDPKSSLSQLNGAGMLDRPDSRFLDLMHSANAAVSLTDGLFDPTIQPLWAALAAGRDPTDAIAAIGWDRVKFDANEITLGASQALTFNGIAQGYATDLVAEMLQAHGFPGALVNIGEYRSIGGPWTLGLSDPKHGMMGNRTLSGGAIATSSPAATLLGNHGHILHPSARPMWSTVAVEAESAAVADSVSTAMVLASRDQIEAIKNQADITRVTIVDFDGNLTTL